MSLTQSSILPDRKRIRLVRSDYLGRRQYFVTLCCYHRRSLFRMPRRANWLLEKLRLASQRHSFSVHAYCVMPDHLHVLAEGRNNSSDLVSFIQRFKQSTDMVAARTLHSPLWQRSFYDHILRGRDSPHSIACYIWMNPVRAGLCINPEDYPFSGSFTLDILERKRMKRAPAWTPPWKETM